MGLKSLRSRFDEFDDLYGFDEFAEHFARIEEEIEKEERESLMGEVKEIIKKNKIKNKHTHTHTQSYNSHIYLHDY